MESYQAQVSETLTCFAFFFDKFLKQAGSQKLFACFGKDLIKDFEERSLTCESLNAKLTDIVMLDLMSDKLLFFLHIDYF